MKRKFLKEEIPTRRSNRSCSGHNAKKYKRMEEKTIEKSKSSGCEQTKRKFLKEEYPTRRSTRSCSRRNFTTNKRSIKLITIEDEENEASGNLNALKDKKSLQKNNSSSDCNLQNITAESSRRKVQSDPVESQVAVEKSQNSEAVISELLEDILMKVATNEKEIFGQEIVKIDSSQYTAVKEGRVEELKSSKGTAEFESNFKEKRTMSGSSNEKLENSLPEDGMNPKVEIDKENNTAFSLKCDRMKSKIETERENNSTEELSSKCNGNNKSVQKGMTEKKHFPSAFDNYFDIKIPLIGKPIKMDNSLPVMARYDLAMEINRRKAAYEKKMGYDKIIPQRRPWEMSEKTVEEKEAEADKEQERTLSIANYISRIYLRILRELDKETYDEDKVIRHFEKFLIAPVTPKALLYVSQFVHFVMWCRKNKEFSPRLRAFATKVYDHCHVMFPIPDGYNFITVYTQQVKNFLPNDFKTLESLIPLLHSTNVLPECDGKIDGRIEFEK